MPQRICPWWLGYLLASPLRRLMSNPDKLLSPYVREGMTILEPGPGMGFYTLPLAQLVGPSGRVIAVDIQPKMLASLERRAAKAGVRGRVETRIAAADSLGIADLAGKIDFTLAFAVVHELPSVDAFFAQAAEASKPGAMLLLAEPSGHVKAPAFEKELQAAAAVGFVVVGRSKVSHCSAAVLKKA